MKTKLENKIIATFEGFYIEMWKNGKYLDNIPCFDYLVKSQNPNIEFCGQLYKPSVSAYYNDFMMPIELLQWLTLYYPANDPELFNDYTPAQLAFANSSECEVLSAIMDFAMEKLENRDYRIHVMYRGSYVVFINECDSPLLFIHVPEL